ncbi:hypothetical protein AWB77_01292 [Caballeronia fortuita]|uniref:Metal ABC transporter ATPase n=1 Tax=Caballeronia fortuita TaxID=1777138 RepID=A0A158A018_9BURK|nr:hypothetical protein [Caballeronia fortuita]SAK51144.1 hypothetical protein AWB77_01292 [Caballeronia fortuita]
MGLGMQIAYLGFTGSGAIEREAGIELLRLADVASDVVDCKLTIKASPDMDGRTVFDAQLVLLTRAAGPLTAQCSTETDASAAMHHAFDDAIRLLSHRRPPGAI